MERVRKLRHPWLVHAERADRADVEAQAVLDRSQAAREDLDQLVIRAAFLAYQERIQGQR